VACKSRARTKGKPYNRIHSGRLQSKHTCCIENEMGGRGWWTFRIGQQIPLRCSDEFRVEPCMRRCVCVVHRTIIQLASEVSMIIPSFPHLPTNHDRGAAAYTSQMRVFRIRRSFKRNSFENRVHRHFFLSLSLHAWLPESKFRPRGK
jgi:hypothetical protein